MNVLFLILVDKIMMIIILNEVVFKFVLWMDIIVVEDFFNSI